MSDPVKEYFARKIEDLCKRLEDNNFNAYSADNSGEALEIVKNIINELEPVSISWGGSLTFKNSGIYDVLKNMENKDIIDTFDSSLPKSEIMELRRKALFSDLFITGTNAITENGTLVNLDMIGNRVGAITFGPKHVIILAGRNKIVKDFDSAVKRIKHYVAPVNVRRLNKKTPCLKTSLCMDCSSPDRICNVWSIIERSFPEGRINLIFINEDLGY